MNVLSTSDRARIVACLVEGNSQRATVRMTGAAKKTVSRLALELNFCRIHQSARVTPAMAAGLSDHVWSLSELVELMESQQPEAVLV